MSAPVRRLVLNDLHLEVGAFEIHWHFDVPLITVIDPFGASVTEQTGFELWRPGAAFDLIKARVDKAAVQAASTCQVCGAPGAAWTSKDFCRTADTVANWQRHLTDDPKDKCFRRSA